MIYENIPGWIDYSVVNLYRTLVNSAPSTPIKVVEIGCWLGKSTTLLAELIKQSGKSITLYAIDTWAGSPVESEHQQLIAEMGGPDKLYEKFLENIKPFDDIIRPIRKASIEAATLFKERELNWAFVDAGHTYKDVYDDILAWLPKVINFGVLSGHDSDSLEVQKALDEIFGRPQWLKYGNCWINRV